MNFHLKENYKLPENERRRIMD